MVIASSGQIAFSDIQTEFGGVPPVALSEYYNAASGIPASGSNGLLSFRGKSAQNLGTPVLNFDAANLSTLTIGNGVDTWSNTGSFGSGYDAVGYGNTYKPLLGQVGSYYHVAFDRNYAQYFNVGGGAAKAFTWFVNGSTYKGFTIFVVGRYQGSAATYERWFDFGNGNPNDTIWFGRTSTTNVTVEMFNGGTNLTGWVQAANGGNDTNWHIWCVRTTNNANGTNSVLQIFKDNTNNIGSHTRTTALTNRTTSQNYIGRSEWNDPYLNAHMRQMLWYDYAMTDTEVSNTMTTLRSKWGI